ncbi:MAG TPA: hypothetical protein VK034_07485 [Enhygromyxa sp.]|nr:hypothetical protein [Enhygromyxa sp.]
MFRIQHILVTGVLGASWLAIGCVGAPSGPSGGDGDGDGDEETEDDDEEDEEDEETDDDDETNDDETNDDETDAETGEDADPCEAFCEIYLECWPDPGYPMAECLVDCAEELEISSNYEGCAESLGELFLCFGGLTCEQFEMPGDRSYPCAEQEAAVDVACADAECGVGGGGDEQGTYCSYQYSCYTSGLHRVECTQEGSCTCLIDDVEVGSCDQLYPALCEPFAFEEGETVIIERLNQCCGWELEY